MRSSSNVYLHFRINDDDADNLSSHMLVYHESHIYRMALLDANRNQGFALCDVKSRQYICHTLYALCLSNCHSTIWLQRLWCEFIHVNNFISIKFAQKMHNYFFKKLMRFHSMRFHCNLFQHQKVYFFGTVEEPLHKGVMRIQCFAVTTF